MLARCITISHRGIHYNNRVTSWRHRTAASTTVTVCVTIQRIGPGQGLKLPWPSRISLKKPRCRNVEESPPMASSASSRSLARSHPHQQTSLNREGLHRSSDRPCSNSSRAEIQRQTAIRLNSFQAFLREAKMADVPWQ